MRYSHKVNPSIAWLGESAVSSLRPYLISAARSFGQGFTAAGSELHGVASLQEARTARCLGNPGGVQIVYRTNHENFI
jgi:hypothetical protein